MKERYIFFTLLIIAAGMLISSRVGKKAKSEIYPGELALGKRLKQVAAQRFPMPEKISLDKIQDLTAFSYYEGMLTRSPFFRVQSKQEQQGQTKQAVLPVEEQTPTFIYKGKIGLGNRLMVIIEQTRSGEVFMVARGDNVDGYKIMDITDAEVILSKEGEADIILKTIERP